MAAHTISRREVGLWPADSAIKTVTLHLTDEDSAEDIMRNGVQIAHADAEAAWGQGFYSSTRPDYQYGDVVLRVAVRLKHPLIIDDSVRVLDVLEDLGALHDTEGVRASVLAAGYDGLIVHFGSGQTWVVAYDDEQVKVVAEDRGHG